MRPAGMSSREGLTCIPICSCRWGQRFPLTRLKPERSQLRGWSDHDYRLRAQQVGEQVMDGLEARHAEAAGNCAIDYAFHQTIGGVDEESLLAIRQLVEREGVTSIKLFMAYPGAYYSDDGQILRAMQVAGNLGVMTMMHAENGIAIDVLRAQAIAKGNTDPVFHGLTRPPELEGEATHRPCSSPKSRETRCISFTSRHLMRLKRLPEPVIAARTCLRRPVRNISG